MLHVLTQSYTCKLHVVQDYRFLIKKGQRVFNRWYPIRQITNLQYGNRVNVVTIAIVNILYLSFE